MWVYWLIVVPFALYGLHRICLRLEEHGYLYYWHKHRPPGGTSPFLGLQELIQPNVRQVVEAEDHSEERADDDRYSPIFSDAIRRLPKS